MIRLILVLFFLWPLSAWGQTAVVPIKSGEHDVFSRLVLELPEAATWTLGRQGDSYALKLSGLDVRFDLSQAFARIPKTRITALTLNNKILTITHAPQTHAIAFELPDRILVIDVKSGGPPENSPFEAALSAPNVLPIVIAETPPNDAADPKPTAAPQTEGLREQLIEQIAQGVSSGLLVSEPPIDPPLSDMVLEEPQLSVTETDFSTLPTDQLTLRSAANPHDERHAEPEEKDVKERMCLPDEVVAVETWGTEDAPLNLGALRAEATSERDTPQAEQLLHLARHYIYLSFGAEAQAVLANFESEIAHRSELLALAALMDGETITEYGAFTDQRHCAGKSALWAAALNPNRAFWSDYNHDAILAYLSEMPPRLRAHVGAILAENYTQASDPDRAQKVLDIIKRSGAPLDSKTQLAEAATLISAGKNTEGTDLLEELASDMQPEALIKYIETVIETNAPLDLGALEHADALAKTLRDDRIGVELFVVSLRGKIYTTDGLEVLKILEADRTLPEDQRQSLISSALRAITQKSNMIDFITTFHKGTYDGFLDADDKVQVAQKLSELAFHDRALDLLPNVETNEARLIAARSYAAKGDLQTAAALLNNLNSEEAKDLKAKLLLTLNLPKDAFETTQSDESSYAVLAEGWSMISEDSRYKSLANLMDHSKGFSSPEQPTLANADEVLALSQSARLQIQNLITAIKPPS